MQLYDQIVSYEVKHQTKKKYIFFGTEYTLYHLVENFKREEDTENGFAWVLNKRSVLSSKDINIIDAKAKELTKVNQMKYPLNS